jgi:hypothetical protein
VNSDSPHRQDKEASREDMLRSLGEAERQASGSEAGWELVGVIVVLIVTVAMIAAVNFYVP